MDKTALQLPEVLDCIGSFLQPPDLFSCIQVSQFWNNAFIPCLWCTVDDSQHQWPIILSNYDSDGAKGNKDRNWIYFVFQKYGHFIRHLYIRNRVLIWVAAATEICTHLTTLSLSITNKTHREYQTLERAFGLSIEEGGKTREQQLEPAIEGPLISPIFKDVLKPQRAGIRTIEEQENDWITTQKYWLIIRQNLGLKVLNMDNSLSHLCFLKDSTFFCDTMLLLPHLTRLSLYTNSIDINLLLNSLPRLQHLTLSRYSPFKEVLVLPMTQLVSVQLRCAVAFPSFFALLRHLPNLESIQLISLDKHRDFSEQDCRKELCDIKNKLKELTISFMNPVDGCFLPFLFPSLPHLTHLTLEIMCSDAIAHALVTHCKQLEHLRLVPSSSARVAWESPIHTVADIILSHCENLKTFDAMAHRIQPYQIAQHPWVCTQLENFRCHIVGLHNITPREQTAIVNILTADPPLDTDELEDYQIEVIEKHRQRQEEHLIVYDQLAKMTHLRILELGAEVPGNLWSTFNYGSRFLQKGGSFHCALDLSLASGFDRLESLKNLEVFKTWNPNHQIKKAEQEWMIRNWPRVRVVRAPELNMEALLQNENSPRWKCLLV